MGSGGSNSKNLEGQEFGRLTVIKRVEDHVSPSGNRAVKWECKCFCGSTVAVVSGYLLSGTTKSCGCLHKEDLLSRTITHGKSKSSEHNTWTSIKQRCLNPKSQDYPDYGGRGIKIQQSWSDSFEEFYKHVGDKPSPDHSLDRIDCNGNYEEGNVRWATSTEQSYNRRKSNKSGNKFKYVYYHKKSKKYFGKFQFGDEGITTGAFVDEKDCAIAIYNEYFKRFGYWPKYCEEHLLELGLIS